MTKHSANNSEANQVPSNFPIDVNTLEYLENEIYFKESAKSVKKIANIAFIELLRSDLCDDVDFSNKVLDSWYADNRTHTTIQKKILPDNVTSIKFSLEY